LQAVQYSSAPWCLHIRHTVEESMKESHQT
jgi:hypothetical protein